MLSAIVKSLLIIAGAVLGWLLIGWALPAMGVNVPAKVMQVIMVVVALLVILAIVRICWPVFKSWSA